MITHRFIDFRGVHKIAGTMLVAAVAAHATFIDFLFGILISRKSNKERSAL